jgi:histidyl-tRNA synthetase
METNILRVLDCKNAECKKIAVSLPPVTSFMVESSRKYLDDVVRLLKLLEIDVTVSPSLVRGLDYYIHTVWEVTHPALGAQDALAGGGRYRITLAEKTVEGVGFAMGFERLIMAVASDNPKMGDADERPGVWLVSFGPQAFEENLKLMQTLRFRGIRCGMDLAGRSMKAQMRAADRAGAMHVIIRGDQEISDGTFQLKDMKAGAQTTVSLPELLEKFTPRPVLA